MDSIKSMNKIIIYTYNTIAKLVDSNANKETLDNAIQKIRFSLNPNPVGQEHNVPSLGDIKLKGVQHKYPETVLFFPSQGQACYCTRDMDLKEHFEVLLEKCW